jgi:hypothetical protein
MEISSKGFDFFFVLKMMHK